MSASSKLRPCFRTRRLQACPPKGRDQSLATTSLVPGPRGSQPQLPSSKSPLNTGSGSQLRSSSEPHYLYKLSSSLSYHWDTLPPIPAQLAHADKFFQLQPPRFLWSAPKFKIMNFGYSPEVCFLGRSNVGKSSLLNALLCKKIARTSSKPGRTKEMNAYAVGRLENNAKNRLVLLDMPGYGKASREEWGKQIMKYLRKRKQLKRVFLLVDAVHGIKGSDKQLLDWLKQAEIPFQVILSKVDKIIYQGNTATVPSKLEVGARMEQLRKIMEDVKKEVQPDSEEVGGAIGEIISCSAEKWIEGKRMGVDALRFAMLQAAGLELRPKVKLAKPVEIVSHEEIFGMKQDG